MPTLHRVALAIASLLALLVVLGTCTDDPGDDVGFATAAVTVPTIAPGPAPDELGDELRAARVGELARARAARAHRPPAVRPAPRSAPAPAPAPVAGDPFDALARCESGGNPRAVGGGGRYFGAFQFALGTWRSVGETGNPVDYPYEHQKAAARRLQARSGWGQWPLCSRRLGLR